MESLRWGRDVFIPFLMQHTELTPEDEKLFAKIMSLENEWFARAEKTKTPVSDREIDILRDVLSQMRMDDIGLVYEDNVIVARDGNNRWQGIEFYHFLIDEALNFDENGELVGMVMDAETLADFKELAEYHGVPVADSHGIPHYIVPTSSLPCGNVCVSMVHIVRVSRRTWTTSCRAIRRGRCLPTANLSSC